MQIQTIKILSQVEDVFNSNVDISITLQNGRNYILVAATPKNLLTLMDNENSDFLSPGDPMVIVKKLTKEVVEKAIEAYAKEDEGYYLKFYAANLDVKTLDVLEDRRIARSKFRYELFEKGESSKIEYCDLIDFNNNNPGGNK